MAIDASEMIEVYARLATREVNARTIFMGLCNTNYQGIFDSGALTTRIPQLTTDVASSDYVEGADWASPGDADINYVDFTPNVRKQASEKIDWDEEENVPIDVVAGTARKIGRKFAEDIDDHVVSVMLAGTPNANTRRKGATANYVGVDGSIAGSGGEQVYLTLRELRLRASVTNVISTASEDGVSAIWCAMSPQLFNALEEYLRASGNSDQIAYEVIRNGMAGRFGGNVDIVLSNRIPTATVSAKVHQQMVMGSADGTTYANRATNRQLWTPDTNPSGPYYRVNEVRRFGAVVQNGTFLFKGQIQAEA